MHEFVIAKNEIGCQKKLALIVAVITDTLAKVNSQIGIDCTHKSKALIVSCGCDAMRTQL